MRGLFQLFQLFGKKERPVANREPVAREDSEANSLHKLYYKTMNLPDQFYPDLVLLREDLETNTFTSYSMERDESGRIETPLSWIVTTTKDKCDGEYHELCELSEWDEAKMRTRMDEVFDHLNGWKWIKDASSSWRIASNLDVAWEECFLDLVHGCGFMDKKQRDYAARALETFWKALAQEVYEKQVLGAKEGITNWDGFIPDYLRL